ncbi:TonB-dependent receptor [Sphingomonas sp. AP4-R1]|uniref:TonB-dependent receptor plug domain-containing protein n=1 Tax=Sphingomonas sp. AP4-R1 TaxID=2735134 RepID=UPI001493603E|nr:TonB-dependent receptor [Sphingomonas sp. AP4-R1]QJU59764.1 TonB-dependent receptor [Sphingomonas sp. AP4-R1]
MKKTVLLAGIALFAPVAALAEIAPQEAPQPDAAATPSSDATDAADPATIVVSANRSPIAIDRVAASVTVLDKKTIDRMGDLGVSDLLLRTPGVSFSRNGGYGTATSLRIRGAESDQTVVVIDGVKLNDPSSTGGGYNFANLLTGDASRIEVLRGPQSTLWGSQAIGGVVNIVTPMPTKSLEGSFDAEAGSRRTASGRAAVGGLTGPLAWRIGGQAFTTDGISAIAPAFGGRERDGYSNRSVTGRAVLTIADGVSADVRGYYSDGRVDIDGFSGDSAEYSLNKEFVGYAGLNVDLFGGRLRNRFAYGYTDTNRDNYNPTLPRAKTFDAAGHNKRLEYQGTLAVISGVDAVFGIENERSNFRSVSPSSSLSVPIPAPSRGKAELTGIYGQVNAEVYKGLTLTGGIRHDDHNRYGSKTLFSGGAAWALPTGTVLRANYSEGFKAPTLYQLFSEYGNTNLRPEQAKGWEAGAEQRLWDGKVSFGVTYFERRSRDLIIYNGCSTGTTDPLCRAPGNPAVSRFGYYLNVSRAFAHGIEATAAVKPIARVTMDGNFSWTASEDRSRGAATYGFQLARRPSHTANGSITYAIPDGPSLGAAIRWAGESFDNATHTTRLAPYTLVDLRGEIPLSKEYAVFARVENLFDEKYMTVYRYGTLGRSVYFGFKGRF